MNNYLSWEQTLFKDREIFEPGYVPEAFLYREKQLKRIGHAIAPGIKGEQPQNMVCIGPPGTGKTTSIRKIIDEAEQISTSELIIAYVNCRFTPTRFSVLSDIYRKISGIEPPGTGIALKKFYEKIAETLAAKNKSLFAVLDDADFLLLRGIYCNVANDILRLYENRPVNTGLCTVHSTQRPPLDDGLGSLFMPVVVKFPSYSWDETFNILSTRAKLGFYSDVVNKEIIEKITQYTVPKGDVRFGIDLLKRSAFHAELRASVAVTPSDVDAALVEASKDRLSRYLKVFSETERALLDLASEMVTVQAGELFSAFHERTHKGYTTFHKALNSLMRAKLIDANIENRGKNGRMRVIVVKQPTSGSES